MSDSKDNVNNDKTVEDAVLIESKVDEASYQVHNEDDKTEPTYKPAKTKLLWLFSIFNFVLILAAAGIAYWFWLQLQSTQSQEENALEILKNEIVEVERSSNARLRNLQDNQQITATSLENLLKEVIDNTQVNQALQKQIAELSGRRPSDWLLAEADYLVNMAGRKLYLEDDIKTARTLLSEADSRLQDLNDPSLFPVRTLIASDLAALNQINPVSETSVALAIGGLIPQVDKLDLRTLQLPEAPSEQSTTPTESIDDWQENLKRTWRGIVGDFIKVTPTNGPIEPYLATRQQWLIEQQLKFALSRAQSAALDKNLAVFRQSLEEAVSLISQHYDNEGPSVDQFLGALEQLLNTDFSKNYPESLQAQAALKTLIEKRIESRFNNNGNSL